MAAEFQQRPDAHPGLLDYLGDRIAHAGCGYLLLVIHMTMHAPHRQGGWRSHIGGHAKGLEDLVTGSPLFLIAGEIAPLCSDKSPEVLLFSVQIIDFLGEKRNDHVTLDLKRRRQQPSFNRPWF